jgi:hypothetical protein
MKKKVYEDLTKENINKSLFDVDFEFDDLDKIEKQLLKDHINKITDKEMEFELMSIDKVVQPLDIMIKLKNNKLTGDVLVKMKDKDENILGIIKFKTLKVTEICNLIDFDFGVGDYRESQKTLTINFIYDDILYSSDGKEYEKLT